LRKSITIYPAPFLSSCEQRGTMMDELMLRQLGGFFGTTEVWLGVAYLVGMFAVLVFRPQQIENVYLFRVSYILFGLNLIVPGVLNALASLTTMGGGLRGGGDPAIAMTVFQFTAVLAKILLGLSIIFALSSLKRYRAVEEPWDSPAEREERHERHERDESHD
jgi:hypothetical protein